MNSGNKQRSSKNRSGAPGKKAGNARGKSKSGKPSAKASAQQKKRKASGSGGRPARAHQPQQPVNGPHDAAFEQLTTIHPHKRLVLESSGDLTGRVIDLLAPIGKGQRALIVSPPRAGKTTILKNIALAIAANDPTTEVFILLVDERPEEVTDLLRSDCGEVVFSSFDNPAAHHIKIAEELMDRAKALVLEGKDVVILLDSITRLARAYNSVARSSGKMLSGGMDANALYRPKKFLGAARAIENGGSLTIIGTALIDTGSRLDEVIFEEFKGTGNMELHLDRMLMEKRVFPTIDIRRSGTRREELLLSDDELNFTRQLRKQIHSLDVVTAMEIFLDRMKRTKTNKEFLAANS